MYPMYVELIYEHIYEAAQYLLNFQQIYETAQSLLNF